MLARIWPRALEPHMGRGGGAAKKENKQTRLITCASTWCARNLGENRRGSNNPRSQIYPKSAHPSPFPPHATSLHHLSPGPGLYPPQRPPGSPLAHLQSLLTAAARRVFSKWPQTSLLNAHSNHALSASCPKSLFKVLLRFIYFFTMFILFYYLFS